MTNRQGFTLIEVLTSVTIASLILVMTASMFNQSTDIWNRGRRDIDVYLEARTSLDFLKQDLQAAVTSKNQDLKPIRDGNPDAANYLGKKYFVPMEFNRMQGTVYAGDYRASGALYTGGTSAVSTQNLANTKGFANAIGEVNMEATDYHPNFDAVALLTLSPMSRQVHSASERGAAQTAADIEELFIGDEDLYSRNQGDVCVAGYYCAYTYDSPLPGSRASIKLHRHFRDSGGWLSGAAVEDDYTGDEDWKNLTFNRLSNGVDVDYSLDQRPVQSRSHSLIFKLGQVLTPLYEAGIYENDFLPFLLKPVDTFATYTGVSRSPSSTLATIEPFPNYPAPLTPDSEGPAWGIDSFVTGGSNSLIAPPQFAASYSNDGLNRDRANSITEQYLYPDEPLAFNVIKFKAIPLRRDTNGNLRNASQVNADYGLTRNLDEWPVILAPDIVDIEITVIDDATAAKFESYNDWIGWNDPLHPRYKFLQRLVSENARAFRMRVPIAKQTNL